MAHGETPSGEDEEKDLWARVHRREPEAERRFCDYVRAIAQRFFHGLREDAEDLMQRAVLSAVVFARREPTPPRDLRVFLQWRCRGVLSAHIRAHRRRPRFQDAEPSLFPDEALPPGDQRQLRKDLLDCVGELPQRLAEIFRERCGGARLSEIAKRHARHPAWATRLYAEALDALKRCMERKGHSEP